MEANHSVPMEYKSAIAKAKKILVAAGIPWSKSTGRYSPFSQTKITTHGVKVHRIGCSDSIALHVYNGERTSEAARNERRELEAKAIQILRDAGMPFDDRGWLHCGSRARAALKTAMFVGTGGRS
jgi:hypothetical protein